MAIRDKWSHSREKTETSFLRAFWRVTSLQWCTFSALDSSQKDWQPSLEQPVRLPRPHLPFDLHTYHNIAFRRVHIMFATCSLISFDHAVSTSSPLWA
jgi:hypothetical protein